MSFLNYKKLGPLIITLLTGLMILAMAGTQIVEAREQPTTLNAQTDASTGAFKPTATALAWWHMPLNLSQNNCVQRAYTALKTTAVGDSKKDSSSAWLFSQNFTATIKCLPQDNNTVLVIIIVASPSGKEAKGVMEGLRTDMRTGLFD